MDFEIIYKDNICDLTDDFIDIGYMAEDIEVSDLNGQIKQIKRSHENGAMTLYVSFPDTSDNFIKEMFKLDEFMSHIQVEIYCYFIFNKLDENEIILKNRLKKFQVVIDNQDDFGNMYGTKIINGVLEDKLTKALFLISKDGAIFYLEMPNDISNKQIDLERLQVELNKAYITYTGAGCH